MIPAGQFSLPQLDYLLLPLPWSVTDAKSILWLLRSAAQYSAQIGLSASVWFEVDQAEGSSSTNRTLTLLSGVNVRQCGPLM